MNTPTIKSKQLHTNVLIALMLLAHAYVANAACDFGTSICTGDSDIVDTYITSPLTIDTSAGAASLSTRTVDDTLITVPEVLDMDGNVLSPALFGTVVRSQYTDVGAFSLINFTGSNAGVVNNVGGLIEPVTYDAVSGAFRFFDRSNWSSDGDGLLYNGGLLAGYLAAISANANVASLTVNNTSIDNNIVYPNGFSGISGSIFGFGEFEAAIFTNSPLLTLNNTSGVNSAVGNIVSYGAGTSLLNFGAAGVTDLTATGGAGNIYVVDRNPLLTAAQIDNPSLVLAYSASEVGPRDSVITLTGNYKGTGSSVGNIFLGSGAHVINNVGGSIGAIMVDQRDAEVVDVIGGVPTVVSSVHGARTFTLNSVPNGFFAAQIGDVTINDVAGAVNTINFRLNQANASFNITANGLGNNSLNLDCQTIGAKCQLRGTTTGFTSYQLDGKDFELFNNINVSGDIRLNANRVVFSDFSTLTAQNVVVGSGATLEPVGVAPTNIVGNLVNKGSILLDRSTLNVSGNTEMQAGSKLILTVGGPDGTPLLNTAGTTTFVGGSVVTPKLYKQIQAISNSKVRVANGTQFTLATNAVGLPTIENNAGFLQWIGSNSTGDFVITAKTGVTSFLADAITPAAKNATEALFSYTGEAIIPVGLQAELLDTEGLNAIRAAERLRPETNDGSIRAVQMSTDKLFNLLDNRLLTNQLPSTLQANSAEPTITAAAVSNTLSDASSGNSPTIGKGVWVQGFGDRAQQQSTGGFDGYNISAAGMAIGIDRELEAGNANTRVGAALAYTRSNVSNTGNTVSNRIDINSFMAAAYASQAYDGWYLNGALGVGRNTYESNRKFNTRTAMGEHDSWQLSGRVDAGWPILIDESFTVIPTAALDYMHLKESGYKENGKETVADKKLENGFLVENLVNGLPVYVTRDSAINLQYQSRRFDSIRAGLGGKAIYSLQEPTWGAELELHGLYRHEFGDLAQDSTARFAFSSNSFYSPGQKPARDSVLFGGSVRLTGDDENDQLTLLTTYDAEMRKKYLGQAMGLAVRYDFDQAPRYLKQAKARLAAKESKQAAMLIATSQSAKATDKDIAAIQQAIQGNSTLVPSDPVAAEKQQVIDNTIRTWVTALSNKNLDVYFNSYAADFETPEGSTRQQWERKRKAEISKAPNPEVKVSYLTIESDGDRALAVFTETPASNAAQEAVRKIVDLEQKNGRWLIVREESMALTD